MPFRLKNAGATYQRLVDTIFEGQTGRNLEAYIDEMVIKSRTEQDLLKDIEETLLTLKKVNMKLNPKECSFGMEEDNFLGYVVTFEGIRANPENAKAVINMQMPKPVKELFMLDPSKCANKKDFRWTDAAEEAFQTMKKLIVELERDSANKGTPNPKVTSDPKEVPESSKGKEEQESLDPIAKADVWKLNTNGASSDHRSGARLILIDPKGVKYSYALRMNFSNSNNDAEYEALLSGLRIETGMKVKKMHAFVASKLVASQVEGSYEARGERTKKYKEKVLEIVRCFHKFQITHIPREQNKKADALSKLAAIQYEGIPKGVLVEELNEKSVDVAKVNVIVEEEGRTWMTPIREYIEKGTLSDDPTEARTIREKINNYVIEDGILYRKSYLGDQDNATPRRSRLGMPIRRRTQRTDEENDVELRLNLNLLEEQREIVVIREARRKQQVEKYYNQRLYHKQLSSSLGRTKCQRQKIQASSDQSRKGCTKSSKHMVQETVSLGLWTGQKY
ncbi:reverse transcriptase domain-containing protein [Tanacetum coccineum]